MENEESQAEIPYAECTHEGAFVLDTGKAKRYKCPSCGVLLFRRKEADPLQTYRCKFVSKVSKMDAKGNQITVREFTCDRPATHIGANENPYCEHHGHARQSQAKRKARASSSERVSSQLQADKLLARNVISEARALADTAPLRSVQAPADALGGVHFL